MSATAYFGDVAGSLDLLLTSATALFVFIVVRARWRRPARTVARSGDWPSGAGGARRHVGARRPIARRAPLRTVVLALGFCLVGIVVVGPLVVALVGACWFARTRWRRLRVARARQVALADSAPDVVELLRLAVTSGLTPYLAVVEVASLAPAVFADELDCAIDDVRRGQRLADALAAMIERVGESARPFCAAIIATERYGVALAPALDAAAAELRRARRVHIETRVRRLPILLSFPLVCCILPAFALLALAPVVVGAARSLGQSPSASVPVPGASHSPIRSAPTAVPVSTSTPRSQP